MPRGACVTLHVITSRGWLHGGRQAAPSTPQGIMTREGQCKPRVGKMHGVKAGGCLTLRVPAPAPLCLCSPTPPQPPPLPQRCPAFAMRVSVLHQPTSALQFAADSVC